MFAQYGANRLARKLARANNWTYVHSSLPFAIPSGDDSDDGHDDFVEGIRLLRENAVSFLPLYFFLLYSVIKRYQTLNIRFLGLRR